ncbi:MAG: LysM domain-containing protein [Clostridia bacterium]|nr:LysM domain-containing protein [Clostridia bacterium]
MNRQIQKFFSMFISAIMLINTGSSVLAHTYDNESEYTIKNTEKLPEKKEQEITEGTTNKLEAVDPIKENGQKEEEEESEIEKEKAEEEFREYVKKIHQIIKNECKYTGTDAKTAAIEEIEVCWKFQDYVYALLELNLIPEHKRRLEILNNVLEDRVYVLVEENDIESIGGGAVATPQTDLNQLAALFTAATISAPALGPLMGIATAIGITAVLTTPSCNSNESQILDDIKSQRYQEANNNTEQKTQNNKVKSQNKKVVKKHRTIIKPIKPKTITTKDGTVYHIVSKGENPTTIAQKHRINVCQLMKFNGLTKDTAKKLQIGQKLIIKQGSRKTGGGSQPPKGPGGNGSENGPPKGPSGNGSGSRKPPSEEEKKILKDGLKATGGAVLKYAEEHYPELVEKGEELLTEVEEAAAEAKDKVVEVIPEIVNATKEPVTNVAEKVCELSSKAIKHPMNDHVPVNFANQLKYISKDAAEIYLKNKTFFNSSWSISQVKDALNFGYRDAINNGISTGKHVFNYLGEQVTVYLQDGIFKTGYGCHVYNYEEIIKFIGGK